MSNAYSMEELLAFLDHAAERGLMPPATATALAVACRNVFSVLNDEEKQDVTRLDLDTTIRRFQNKRAKDFSPQTLGEYGRRIKRAVSMFQQWRDNPAGFRAPTRATTPSRQRKAKLESEDESSQSAPQVTSTPAAPGTFQTAVPIGPQRIVTLLNVPTDLTREEAKKIAAFVEMLAVN